MAGAATIIALRWWGGGDGPIPELLFLGLAICASEAGLQLSRHLGRRPRVRCTVHAVVAELIVVVAWWNEASFMRQYVEILAHVSCTVAAFIGFVYGVRAEGRGAAVGGPPLEDTSSPSKGPSDGG